MRAVALLAVLGSLAACAPDARVVEVDAPLEPLHRYRIVHLVVRSQEPETGDCAAALRQEIIDDLEGDLFTEFVGDEQAAKADLRLTAIIVEIRDAASGARVVRESSGRVRCRVQVDLREVKGDRPIGRFRVDGYGSSELTDAAEEAGAAIADYLDRYRGEPK
jgi:hypothetical protein